MRVVSVLFKVHRTTSLHGARFECAKQCTADAAKPGVERQN